MKYSALLFAMNGTKLRVSCGPITIDGVLKCDAMDIGGFYASIREEGRQVTFHCNHVNKVVVECESTDKTADDDLFTHIYLREQARFLS